MLNHEILGLAFLFFFCNIIIDYVNSWRWSSCYGILPLSNIFLLACLICYVRVPFEWNDEMNKYNICQFSILQDIPVHVVDLTESPVKKFKPSLSSHYPSDEVWKKSMLFPSIPDAMSEVVVNVTLEGYIAHMGV